MKTFFKSILAVAVCASLFAACSKDDTVSDPSNGRKVTMTVTASSELESASGSRTTYDPLTGKISWNETGEYLQVFETAASKTTYANSQEGTVSDGTAKIASKSQPQRIRSQHLVQHASFLPPLLHWVQPTRHCSLPRTASRKAVSEKLGPTPSKARIKTRSLPA